MSIKVKDIGQVMEQFAPAYYKESYDNVGLMVGNNESEVKNILISLDCTLKAIDEALEKGCNLIITHHPLIFKKPDRITEDSLIGKKIIKLIKNDISVYSSHTNLDSVGGGLNDTLIRLLGFNDYEVLSPYSNEDRQSGIGRLAKLKDRITLGELLSKIKSILDINTLRYTGEDDLEVEKIAVINGSGESYIYDAIKKGANCIITGDTSYHHVLDCAEKNIAVIDGGHFATEWPALKIVSNNIKNEILKKGFTNNICISKFSKDPYKYR